MMSYWRRLAPLFAAAAVVVWGVPAAAETRIVKMAAHRGPGFLSGLQRVALLQDDGKGTQTLVLRHVYTAFLKGIQPGDRAGGDLVIDLNRIWGNGGTFVDVMLSTLARPDSVLLLHENGSVLELRGVWGNGNIGVWGNGNIGIWGNGNLGIWGNGNLGIWGNGNLGVWGNGNIGMPNPDTGIAVHGPFFDTAVCGKATTFAEGVRTFLPPAGDSDALEGFFDPLVGVGTSGGCVGFAGIPIPDEWLTGIPIVEDWLTGPLVMTGPLVKVAPGQRIDSLVFAPQRNNWIPIITDWVPQPDQWLAPAANAITDPEDWIPSPENWIPNPHEWFEFAALANGQVHGVHPGRRRAQSDLSIPPFATYTLDAGSLDQKLTSLSGPRMSHVSLAPGLPQAGLPAEWPLVGANRTGFVQTAALDQHRDAGELAPLDLKQSVQLCAACSIASVELGSLWAITDDGRLLLAPEFDAATGSLGSSGVVELGGVMSIDLGPSTLNLKSLGNGLTASIESSGESVLTIDQASITLNIVEDGLDALVPERVTLADKDRDGDRELLAKFDRAGIVERLSAAPGASATLELSWSYLDLCESEDEALVACTGSYTRAVRLVK